VNTPLCETCLNKDTAFVLHGPKYVEEDVCIYDMANFPKMHKCVKYENAQGKDDE